MGSPLSTAAENGQNRIHAQHHRMLRSLLYHESTLHCFKVLILTIDIIELH